MSEVNLPVQGANYQDQTMVYHWLVSMWCCISLILTSYLLPQSSANKILFRLLLAVRSENNNVFETPYDL